MLTVEMLKQNTSLASLTEAQLTAITEMSRNDEASVISTRLASQQSQYDADILSITGINKNTNESSTDYAKRVLGSYKTQVTSVANIQAQLTAANSEVEKLKGKLAAGSNDDALKQQLKDAKAQVTQLQKQLTDKEAEYTAGKAKLEADIKNIQVDHAFNTAAAGLKFKAGITPAVQNMLIQAAKAEVLTKGTPDFVDNKLVFRDTTGNIINNPANNLNPYTADELLKTTSLKDVLDPGINQPGGGTVPPASDNPTPGGVTIDLSNVKNQVEADRAIENYLLAQGLTRDDSAFSSQLLSIRTENKVADLPIR